MGSLSPGEGCADVISRFRPRHTHTNHIFHLGRVCREQGLPSNSPRGGGPFFVRDTGRVFFSRIGPGRASWNPDHHPNPVPPRPPLKSDFPYPGLLTERLNSESARLFLHGMVRRRAGCVPNSHHCLLLFGLATAISWRSMPCKSAVLKPDMHNGRATAGGRPGGRGEGVHRSLSPPRLTGVPVERTGRQGLLDPPGSLLLQRRSS